MNSEKWELRRRILEKIGKTDASVLAESDRSIFQTVISAPEFLQAERVFAYCSTGREVDTRRLMAWCLEQGKPLALPVSEKGGVMDFYLYTGTLETGYWNLQVPPQNGAALLPGPADLMLVPGLCFDARGYRLGWGGGYYDRYLAAHPCPTAGLCRAALLVPSVPTEVHDRPVDRLFTEGLNAGRPFLA